MRSFIRHAIVLGSCAGAAILGSGCEANKATEYVAGVSSQMKVPRDLKVIRLEVGVGGAQIFCRPYKVYNGTVQLPRSLGSFAFTEDAAKSGQPITFTIVGLTENVDGDVESSTNPAVNCLQGATVGKNKARLLRRSRQPYDLDFIRFLPMPLKYSCYDKACPDDQTCKGGTCVGADLTNQQVKALPIYSPELVDGTGGACFHASLCMASEVPAIQVDANDCTYAVPLSKDAPPFILGQSPFPALPAGTPWEGVNVEVSYDGGLSTEILDLDPDEGFFLPDPTKPQRFRLAPGLCAMVKGADGTTHRITSVRASGTCQAKTITQPLCLPDQYKSMGLDANGSVPNPPPPDACSTVELKPPQSALMLVVDDTDGHAAFFNTLKKPPPILGQSTNEDDYVQLAIQGALSDPAFQRTDLGLIYAPGNTPQTKCGGGPDVPTALTPQNKDKIIADLKGRSTVPPASQPPEPKDDLDTAKQPRYLDGALKKAYTELQSQKYSTYFKRAVLVIGNGGFAQDSNAQFNCPGLGAPKDLAKTAHEAQVNPVDTYVMQLTTHPAPLSTDASILGQEGGTGAASYKTSQAQAKFSDIVNSIATCVYDVDDNALAPKNTDKVSFSNPLESNPDKRVTTVGFDAACSAEDQGADGWGFAPSAPQGKKRIFLCKNTCNTYRTVLKQNSQLAAGFGQAPIPIPVFAYRAACVTCKNPDGDDLEGLPDAQGNCVAK